MASRRMFARAITGSGRFLRLRAEARALYYDLGMEADDDGFVEAFVRLRATGAGEEHLRELERAGLILILDEDELIIHIQDWTINNSLRRDRYTPSLYRGLYPQCVGPEPACQPSDNQPEDTGVFLDDSPATQDRLGKDRLEQDRKEQINQDQKKSEEKRTGNGRSGERHRLPAPEELLERSRKTAFLEEKIGENTGYSQQKALFAKQLAAYRP